MAVYRICHSTVYRYEYPVAVSHHIARLEPRSTERQACRRFDLRVEPPAPDVSRRSDYFGNPMHLFSVQTSHDCLSVASESEVLVDAPPFVMAPDGRDCGSIAEEIRAAGGSDGGNFDALQFSYPSVRTPIDDEVRAFSGQFFHARRSMTEALWQLLGAFQEEFVYDPVATEVDTPISQVLATRRGVCQDFAHLAIAALRASGLAARYVSGYILNLAASGEQVLAGADASHAWLSVYFPNWGWADIDPTNNIVCTDSHIMVAYGRDFNDVSPLKGAVTGGGGQSVEVAVTVDSVGG